MYIYMKFGCNKQSPPHKKVNYLLLPKLLMMLLLSRLLKKLLLSRLLKNEDAGLFRAVESKSLLTPIPQIDGFGDDGAQQEEEKAIFT